MRKILNLLVFGLFLTAFGTLAQNYRSDLAYTVTGKVFDQSAHLPMEYSTVALLNTDSSVVNGTITDDQGNFTLRVFKPGDYIVKVGFMGYERFTKNISLGPNNLRADLGEIILEPTTSKLEEVTVVAEKSKMEYKIDKKVVHVGDNLAAVSGNATDVLANVPSVQVDIEGNVSLRGNSNFTVLIDDRPTVLDANEALQQIPASTIQDIEIITNPSAKYDPEGTAGIINIITKKRSLEGLSGLVHLDAGLDDKYGADFLLNYRTSKFNYFIGGDVGSRVYPGEKREIFETYDNDTTTGRESNGSHRRMGENYNIRGGIEWFPDKKTNLRLSGDYGYREYSSNSSATYHTWTDIGETRIRENSYMNSDKMSRGGVYYSLNADFTREFSSREHKVDAEFMYYNRDGDERASNTLLNLFGDTTSSLKSSEIGPATGIRYKINYKQPISEQLKFETGIQGQFGSARESNKIEDYNLETGKYDVQSLFSHDVVYDRNINAWYGLVLGEFSGFGYQVGFRAENTDRLIRLDDTEDRFRVYRWDYFPTLHLSYKLPKEHQVMASYTRRIDRPRGWNFEPFYTWQDAYNVRRGNPDLLPEYINSYELAYMKDFNKNSFSTEVYYRSTENKIEGIRSAYNDSVTLRSYENVGTDQSLGIESMLNLDLVKKWETSLTGNFYHYQVEGEYLGENFDRGGFMWSVRWNNIINITRTTRLQFNPAYESGEIEAQETETGYFIVHGAVKQTLLNNKFDITLQVRDIFSTAKHESEINASDLYSYRYYTHKSPMVMVNITWRINNYKSRNGSNGGDGMDGGGEDME